MYDESDPRANLSRKPVKIAVAYPPRPAVYAKFYETPPQIVAPRRSTWLARGDNAIVGYSVVAPGGQFNRPHQCDEWALLIPEQGTQARLRTEAGELKLSDNSITFIPPGRCEVEFPEGGTAVTIFTTRSDDLVALCSDADTYRERKPIVPLLRSWPLPRDGYRIRTYSLDVPNEPGRFGRIWRCTTMMINCLPLQAGPRDPTKMSPHHHDDFEQYSLALRGSFIHHLRWPWTPNMEFWRNDEHEFCGSPSVAVIPPPVVHTTQAVDQGVNFLVDIFSPPRADFSAMPGWVLNEADYPLPA